MDTVEVKAVQAALSRKAYVVAVDGQFGASTLGAIIAYALNQGTAATAVHAQALAPVMEAAGIVGRYRIAHFLANVAVETQYLQKMRESTSYSSPDRLAALFSNIHGVQDAQALIRKGPAAVANRAYAGVNGNGPEASGDGYAYRGGGYLQHTGRRNYQLLTVATGIDLVRHPERITEPTVAALAACAFWNENGLSLFADRDDAAAVRRGINGPARLDLATTTRIAERIKGLWL